VDLADLAAQRGLRELGDREQVVVDAVGGALGVQHLQIEHAVHVYLHVVPGDADLLRDFARVLLEGVPVADRVDEGEEDVKAGVQRGAVAAEPLDHEGALLGDDDRRARDDDHHQQGETEEDDEGSGHCTLLRYCARRDRTRPSTCATMLRSPRASGRASTFLAVHAEPRSSALPTAPGARSSSGTATSPTSASTARPSRRTGMMRRRSGPRRKATERTESSEKRNHWNQPGMWGPSHTARPTAIAERPKKKTKKAPGVNASDASSASPSTSHSHHDIRRGVYSPTAAGSSREQPSILGARTGPGQHPQQEDEPRHPEQVRPDRGGRHEEVEAPGEREEDGEDVPVA